MSTDPQAKDLFTSAERLAFEAILLQHHSAAARAPGMMLMGLLALLGGLGVAALEWEIIFRVFGALAGSDEAHWSPRLMAFSGVVVIAGFHLHARSNPEHPLVRGIERASGLLIPLYGLGVGLLLAALLYADGLSDIAAPAAGFLALPSSAQEASNGAWVKALFEGSVSPLATLVFAAGVGGIAICNLFVAHRLLSAAEHNAKEAMARLRRLRWARDDMAKITQAQQRHAQLCSQIEVLDQQWDEDGICDAISRQVMRVIAQGLVPHKTWLSARALRKPARFDREDGIAADQVAKRVAQIDAITRADVLRALQS